MSFPPGNRRHSRSSCRYRPSAPQGARILGHVRLRLLQSSVVLRRILGDIHIGSSLSTFVESQVKESVSTESLWDSLSHCKHWPTHGASQAQGAKKSGTATKQQGRFLSLTGQYELPPRTASPERIGESSRSSGSDCAAPGGMVKRTGRCVSLSLRDGVRAVLRLDIVSHTESPSAKKEKTTQAQTALHPCTLHVH